MYAANTTVPIEKSQAEVKKILQRYGATAFMFFESQKAAIIAFELKGRRIKFNVPMPDPIAQNARPVLRNKYDQLCRSRWRALCLAIKAKLECVDSGITSLDQEFLAHIVLPNGQSFGDIYIPQIDSAYQTNEMPPLLPGAV
jgi:hypothetical protein